MDDVHDQPSVTGRQRLLGAAAVIVVGTCAYANSFHGPFVFDGVPKIVENRAIRELWPPWGWLGFNRRPVAYFSFAVDYAVYGHEPIGPSSAELDTRGWHATNLAIHLGAGLVLLGIVYRTLSKGRLAKRYGHDAHLLALGVALIWVVHPLQTQSVTYVVQRIESLMGLLYLLTLGAFVAAWGSSHSRSWYAVSVGACALGMATKEVAVTAPLVVLFYDRIFVAGSWREIVQKRNRYYIALFGTWTILGFLLVSRWSITSGHAGVVAGLSPIQYAQSQPGVIAHYLRLCCVPLSQCLDYWWPVAETASEIVPPTVLIIVLLGATGWCLGRCPPAGFLGLWFFLILAPTSSIMPIKDIAFEHRMYLPLAAAVTAFVIGGYEFSRRKLGVGPRGWLLCVVPVVIVVLAGLTLARNASYQSQLSVWRDVTRKAPHNPRAFLNLGEALDQAGQTREALDCYLEVLRVDARYARIDIVYSNMGIIYHESGDVGRAMANYNKALQINPSYAKGHTNLAIALIKLGKLDDALPHFERAVSLEPENAEFHTNFGQALKNARRLDEAVGHFRRALELDPRYERARKNLEKLGAPRRTSVLEGASAGVS